MICRVHADQTLPSHKALSGAEAKVKTPQASVLAWHLIRISEQSCFYTFAVQRKRAAWKGGPGHL